MNKTIALMTAAAGLFVVSAYAAPPHSSDAASLRASSGRYGQDASNPNVPGATGRTIVPGDPSTIAGDAQATRMMQTGVSGEGGGGD